MSAENKAVVQRYFREIWSGGNLDVADEIVEGGHQSTGGMVMSPDIIKRVVSLFRGAFPDIVYDIQQIISEGDKVMVHWKAQGTHQGEFRGVSPTGKRITYSGFDLYRMVNGKIVERWGQNDDLGLLEQLGAVSVPPLVR